MLPTQDERQIAIQLFSTAWRIGWERFRQQRPTLQTLFDAARESNDALSGAPPVRLGQMTDESYATLLRWWEDDGTSRGARDAYASAVVLFVDDTLKATLKFYNRIPKINLNFNSNINGVTTPEVFRLTSNNVRHHDEWIAPTHQIPAADQAYKAVTAICTVVDRPVPKKGGLSVMAANWAWPVLAVVSGDRSFEGLMAKIGEFMDELLLKTGLESDPHVLAEKAKG